VITRLYLAAAALVTTVFVAFTPAWAEATASRQRVAVDAGHPERIGHLEVSPDGKWLVSGDYSGKVVIRNATNGNLVAELSFVEGGISMGGRTMRVRLAFSPDSKWLAAGYTKGDEGEVALYGTKDFAAVFRSVVHGRDDTDPRGLEDLMFTAGGYLVTRSFHDKERADKKGLARIWRIGPTGLTPADQKLIGQFTAMQSYGLTLERPKSAGSPIVKDSMDSCVGSNGRGYAVTKNAIHGFQVGSPDVRQLTSLKLADFDVSVWCAQSGRGLWILQSRDHDDDIKKPGGRVWLSDKWLYRWREGDRAPTLVTHIGAQNFSEATPVPGSDDLVIAYGKGLYRYDFASIAPRVIYPVSGGQIQSLFFTRDKRHLIVRPAYTHFLGGEYVPESYVASVRLFELATGRQKYAGPEADCRVWLGAAQECATFNGSYTYPLKAVKSLPDLNPIALPVSAALAGIKLDNILEWSVDRSRWIAEIKTVTKQDGKDKESTRLVLGDNKSSGLKPLRFAIPDPRDPEDRQGRALLWPNLDFATVQLTRAGEEPGWGDSAGKVVVYELATGREVGQWAIPDGATDLVAGVNEAGDRIVVRRYFEKEERAEVSVRDRSGKIVLALAVPEGLDLQHAPFISADGSAVWLLSSDEDDRTKVHQYKLTDPVQPVTTVPALVGPAKSFVPLENGRYAIGTRDSAVQLFEADGREYGRFFVFPDGGWLTMLPSGHFSASSAELEKRVFRVDDLGDRIPLQQLGETFHRPDVVLAAFSGRRQSTALESINTVLAAPKISIINAPTQIAGEDLNLQVNVVERGGGIGNIRVFVNGGAVVQSDSRALLPPGTSAATRSIPMRLVPGDNEIKVIAFNAEGSMSSPPVFAKVKSLAQRPGKPQLHALVVGINQFDNPKLNLKYAVPDALAVAAMLKQRAAPLFDRINVEILTTPKETTRQVLLAALTKYRNIAPDDVFVFFIASHGTVEGDDINTKEFFLIPSNMGSTSERAMRRDAISQTELKQLIANIPATKKALFLDTCHSGALGDALMVATRGMSEDAAIKVLSTAVGSTVLSASSASCWPLDGHQGHGVFTWVLLQALGGKADARNKGYVNTLDLAAYVEDEVPRVSEAIFKRKQFPTLHNAGQSFPITSSR